MKRKFPPTRITPPKRRKRAIPDCHLVFEDKGIGLTPREYRNGNIAIYGTTDPGLIAKIQLIDDDTSISITQEYKFMEQASKGGYGVAIHGYKKCVDMTGDTYRAMLMDRYVGNIQHFVDKHDVTVDIVIQMLGVIQEMHLQNVFHNDMYPRNMVYREVDGKFEFKIIDFGVASEMKDPMPEELKIKDVLTFIMGSCRDDKWSDQIIDDVRVLKQVLFEYVYRNYKEKLVRSVFKDLICDTDIDKVIAYWNQEYCMSPPTTMYERFITLIERTTGNYGVYASKNQQYEMEVALDSLVEKQRTSKTVRTTPKRAFRKW
jgi:hypothetical protein